LPPRFLTLDEVLALHADQIRRYGGMAGLRDAGLLESAVAVPRAAFGGDFLHDSTFEQAAAYLFHLCRNHPFLDGNKRTALAAALAFLWLEGHEVVAGTESISSLVEGVAEGRVGKAEVAEFLRRHATRASGRR
jgi:death-on-curing protein